MKGACLMKKLIACLLACAILCSFSCLAEDFELMGFSFASTPAEIEALFGGIDEKYEDSHPEAGKLSILRKYDVEFFGYSAEAISLTFYNDRLMAITINYSDAVLSDAAYLFENVSAEYGEGVVYDEDYYAAGDLFGETRTYAGWNCFEVDTEGYISLDLVEDSEYFCFLIFCNNAVMHDMEAAVMPLMDE